MTQDEKTKFWQMIYAAIEKTTGKAAEQDQLRPTINWTPNLIAYMTDAAVSVWMASAEQDEQED